MFSRFLLFSFLFILILSACVGNNKNEFTLPNDIHLSDYQLISPFFIEQLNEIPVKFNESWNDSIVRLAGIYSITITSKGMKNPDELAEKSIFKFAKEGSLMSFEHFNFEIDSKPQSVINFSKKKGVLRTYFGENINQPLSTISTDFGKVFIRSRSSNVSDSTFLYGTNLRPKLIFEKSGGRISKLNIIISEDQPIGAAKELLVLAGLNAESIFYAEKSVTYVDNNYRPLKSYMIDEDFIQTALVAEWQYENHKKLIAYRKFVNSSAVKEYSFTYSDDKLLRSFVFNRMNYKVEYR